MNDTLPAGSGQCRNLVSFQPLGGLFAMGLQVLAAGESASRQRSWGRHFSRTAFPGLAASTQIGAFSPKIPWNDPHASPINWRNGAPSLYCPARSLRDRLPMRSGLLRVLLAISAISAVGACNGPISEPYYLGRWKPDDDPNKLDLGRRPPMTDPTGRPYLHVCYSKMLHSPEQIRDLVRDNCTDPKLVDSKADLYTCSLSAPVRATFSCSTLSRAAAEARPTLNKDVTPLGEIRLNESSNN